MKLSESLQDKAWEAVRAFYPDRTVSGLEKLGEGHINDTFLAVLAGERPGKYVLQRLNRSVFGEPELIMANLRILADHLDRRLGDDAGQYFANWQVVRPHSAADGRDYHLDRDNNFWRLVNYVRGGIVVERLPGAEHAREAGRALGLFHRLVSDLNPALLADTLPGFHVTPRYLAAYDKMVRREANAAEEYCAGVIDQHRAHAPVLEDAVRNGLLPVRVIHGDPRLANILFDEQTGRAVSIIDLDTVKPGLLHHDIGDCLRSCCNPAGDDVDDPDEVRFDTTLCAELFGGYLTEMGELLTETDYQFVYPAVRLLAFELGLRFFTDHLAGDVYFKVPRPGRNLQRAQAQFKLLESIEESETEIRAIIKKCRHANGA
jgi:hypothetical protein